MTLAASVEARAIALLNRRLQQHPLGEQDELLARAVYLDAFRAGYVRGGKDALSSCTDLATALADRSFRDALQALITFIDAESEAA